MSNTSDATVIPTELTYDFANLVEALERVVEHGEKAIASARSGGRLDLVGILEQVREQNLAHLEELRTLVRRARDQSRLRDVVEEASVESFPASDAPAY